MRPNGIALALAGQASIAGTASAYLEALQFMLGAVLAPLAGLGGQGAPAPAAVAIGILCAGALGFQVALARGRRADKPAPGLTAEVGPGARAD